MQNVFAISAPKKPANLSINSDLLKKAREFGINLSAAFETALAEIVRQKQEEEWLEANKEAIEAYNTHVETHGTFSKSVRRF